MDIEKRFIDLKFLDENVIERNRSILKNTFDIDIDNLISLIRNEIDIVNINMDAQLKLIHQYVIESMKEYNINISKCFSRSSVQSNRFIDIYLIENLKLNIYLYYINSQKDKKDISQIHAVENYLKTETDENIINYYLREKDKEEKKKRFRDFSRIITMNINQLKKIDDRYEDIINIFINEDSYKTRNKRCYKIVSNVFIEMMHNVLKTGYANVYSRISNQKKLSYNYNDALKRMENFFKRNIDFEEKYFWERINNTMFIHSLYFYVKDREKDYREQQDLFKYLIPIVYLPNVFLNEYFIGNLISIYKNEQAYYKYKGEFEENVKKLCLELAFLVIPLYNKIFSVILHEVIDGLKIDTIEKYLIGRKEKCCIKKFIKYMDSKLDMRKRYTEELFDLGEYVLLSSSVCQKIDFNIFKLNNVIDFIGDFDEQFLNIVSSTEDYKLILKDFILKILFRSCM